jgi:sigma-B regulation protein RsbU (phosphoserine phosphatase)
MLTATPPAVQMRLVRDDADIALHVASAEIAQLRRDLAQARADAVDLRRRAVHREDQMARLDGELRLAGRLQRDFLPKRLPEVGPARFAALFRPAGHVSGDFYDVVRLDEDHVGFYVADAVGHGVPAALLTMFIKHSLATKHIEPGGGYRLLSPGETLGRLNDTLIERDLSSSMFATAAYGLVNVRTRTVILARAGHPCPLVLGTTDGSTRTVECDGGLLGIMPGETFAEATLTLSPGEQLLLYTDGVEVAFAAAPADSLDRWRSLLATHGDRPVAELLDGVATALDAFNGDAPPRDDLTLLALTLD